MKIFQGKVVSKKMVNTAAVVVERLLIHPKYKKRFKRSKTYQVHDMLGSVEGQMVKFVACKPISKLKKWKIVEILGVAKADKGLEKKVKKEIKKK